MQPDKITYRDYRIPSPQEFEAIFSHFYFAENKTHATVTKTLLPSFQTIMVFNFGAQVFLVSKQKTRIEVDKCITLGPIKLAFEYNLPPHSQILVVNFKEDAFFRFFGKACLSDHFAVHPDEATEENCFTRLWFELNNIDTAEGKVEHIINFCRPYLNLPTPASNLLSNFKSDTLSPIKFLAEQTGQTERNLQLLHKKHFGYSAKEINRFQRFEKALKCIQEISLSSKAVNWFEVINQCGYYDQSQLIHDFKHFINLSPGNYLKFQQDICQSTNK